MLSLKDPWGDLDTLERWRREGMTPEARAAEDAAERRRNIKVGIGVAAGMAAVASITILPWCIGAWTMVSWIGRRG